MSTVPARGFGGAGGRLALRGYGVGSGGHGGHGGSGHGGGGGSRRKGQMKNLPQVPFRRYMFDNSSIYRKR